MTRPDDFRGSSRVNVSQGWTRTAPYPGPPPPPGPHPYPHYQPQQYPASWAGPGRAVPPGPMPPGPVPPGPMPPSAVPAAVRPRTEPSTGKIVAFVLAGFLVLGLFGGTILLLAAGNTAGTDSADPFGTAGSTPSVSAAADPPAVTVALPPVVDGRPQIDNQYSRQLADSTRQQLEAVTSGRAVVGVYGDPGQPPAFMVMAGTLSAEDPDLVLTGMAAGFQNSLGPQELTFVDQPAGPLGGTMRCAQHAPMTTCMWAVDGAFGLNVVFEQDLAQAAATTVRVREAVEIHTN